ncbi:hypothetical protein J0910_30940 [Nocardiopsis sp. CNT-189]|uniref:hypothetical protein n=1 Tax=Nocardiopsis oceanisediminis TaxID=2816862 RepID=UPI003B2B8F0A
MQASYFPVPMPVAVKAVRAIFIINAVLIGIVLLVLFIGMAALDSSFEEFAEETGTGTGDILFSLAIAVAFVLMYGIAAARLGSGGPGTLSFARIVAVLGLAGAVSNAALSGITLGLVLGLALDVAALVLLATSEARAWFGRPGAGAVR